MARIDGAPHVACEICGNNMACYRGPGGPYRTCKNCNVSIKADRKTLLPIGKPADVRTRKARIAVHQELDSLWLDETKGTRNQQVTRLAIYKWLAFEMQIPSIHIGEMTLQQCRQAVEIVRKLKEEARVYVEA